MGHDQTDKRLQTWRGKLWKRGQRWPIRLSLSWFRRHPQPRPLPTPFSAYVLFGAALLFPSALKVIKAVRAAEGRITALELAQVLCADVAVACVSFAVALVLGRGLRRVRYGAWIFGVLTTLYLAVLLVLSAVEHQAWVRSASLLDWKMFWYTIEHYQEMRGIIAAETTVSGVLLFVLAGVLALAPLLTDVVATQLLGREARFRRSLGAAAVLCTIPLMWAAAGDPKLPALYPLKQSAVVGLLAGAFSAAEHAVAGTAHFAPATAERTRKRIAQALAAAHLTQVANGGRPKNVMLLVLESTRFDATSLFAERLDTTPRLKLLTEPGLLVDRVFVDMPHTSKALTSVICGYSPRFSVQISEAEPGGLPRPCLPHVLGNLGYRSAFFQAATGSYEGRHQFALNAGYNESYTRESFDEKGFEESNYLAVEDKVMVDPILRWVDAQKNNPFLLTILTCITHHDYGLPSNFARREFLRKPANLGGRMPRPWSDYNRYLNTVAYADEFLGQLIDGLKKRGRFEDTLIVVVGDHGQAFLEHGQKAHNTVIWEEGLRVPLVMHNAELFPEPRVIEGVRRQVDIAPTVLTQLGVTFPADLFDGRDLLTAPEHERAYSSCWYDRRCMAETSGQLRVIDHFDNQPMEVYDLASDPFERLNLRLRGSTQERAKWDAVAQAARKRMQQHQAQLEQRYTAGDDAMQDWLLRKEPRPTYPLHARLDDAVELLGYDTPTHDVVPDQFWEVIVYFKCLKQSAPGWRFLGVLETPDGRQDQVDHHPANGRFYLHNCKPGQFVADHVRVWIPGDYPPGEARYWWGGVLLKDLGHISRENPRLGRRDVGSLERGLLVRNQALLLAKLNVKPVYRPDLAELLASSVLKTAPKIAKPLNVRFGDNLVLVDAHVEPAEPRRLASVTVTTTWRVDSEQSGPWQIAVHLDSDKDGYWLRRAHTPVDGIHPIANWKAGTWVVDTYTIPVPDYMPEGPAKIWIGVRTAYKRMQVTDPAESTILDRRVLAGTISVQP